jgi:hypothetical protein
MIGWLLNIIGRRRKSKFLHINILQASARSPPQVATVYPSFKSFNCTGIGHSKYVLSRLPEATGRHIILGLLIL